MVNPLEWSHEAETAAIGSVLIDSQVLDTVPELNPAWFFLAAHQSIVEVMLYLQKAKVTPDPVAVTVELQKRQLVPRIVPTAMVMELARSLGTSTGFGYYVGQVRKLWEVRCIRLLGHKVATQVEITDPALAISDIHAELHKIECGLTYVSTHASDTFQSTTEVLLKEADGKEGHKIISTGWKSMDEIVTALEPGIFQLYCARPGGGKTSIAINLLSNLGKAGVPAAVFWLEDPVRMFTMRLAAVEAGINPWLLRHGSRMTGDAWSYFNACHERVKNWKLWIEPTQGLGIKGITQRMRYLARQHGIRVFVVDHIGRVKVGNHDRLDMDIGNVAEEYIEEAGRCGACPVAFHQLSKRSENSRRQDMSMIFNSDVLAQHARVLGFISIPEEDGNTIKIKFPKMTYGRKNSEVTLHWNPSTMEVFDRVAEPGPGVQEV